MPLFWTCLAFILGIAAAPHLVLSNLLTWPTLVISLLASILEKRHSRSHPHRFLDHPIFKIPFALLVFCFFLGVNLFHAALPKMQADDVYHFSGQSNTVIIGMVKSDPRRTRRTTSAVIACEEVISGSGAQFASGKTLVTLPQGFNLVYGDRVLIDGEIENTIDDDQLPIHSWEGRQMIFSKINYPTINVLSTEMGNPIVSALYRLRGRAEILISEMIPFPESAVLSGILLGLETSIPDYLWNGYRASGIAHIVVISGFNVSIIAILVFRAFSKALRYQYALPLTIFVVCLYTILVGADTPVVRAAVMATVGLPAASIGRRSLGIHNLTIAAALMLCLNPFQLWDISFQLSFLATLSLLVMADPIIQWVSRNILKKPKDDNPTMLLELIVTTLCASFVVFPILFKLTGTFSTVSIPANILVAPLQPPIMALGGAAVLVGLLFPIIGNVFAKMVWPLVAFCNQIALRLSASPASGIFLPGWIYGLSLALVMLTLAYFSTRQIIHLSRPVSKNASNRE